MITGAAFTLSLSAPLTLAASFQSSFDCVSRCIRATTHLESALPIENADATAHDLSNILETVDYEAVALDLRDVGLISLLSLSEAEQREVDQNLSTLLSPEQRLAFQAATIRLEQMVGTEGPVRLSLFTDQAQAKRLLTAPDNYPLRFGGTSLSLDALNSAPAPSDDSQRVLTNHRFSRTYGPIDMRRFADLHFSGESFSLALRRDIIELNAGVINRFGALTVAGLQAEEARGKDITTLFPGFSPIDILLIGGQLDVNESWIENLVSLTQARLLVMEAEGRSVLGHKADYWNLFLSPSDDSYAALEYDPQTTQLAISVRNYGDTMPHSNVRVHLHKEERILETLKTRVRPPVQDALVREIRPDFFAIGGLNGAMPPALEFLHYREMNPYRSREALEAKLEELRRPMIGDTEEELIYEGKVITVRAFEALLEMWGG